MSSYATVTETLAPIADITEWSDETLNWHLNFYQFESRYDATWSARVAEIQSEIERRANVETSQTWTTRTTQQADNEDNDVLSYTIDEDTYFHDCWLTLSDWQQHDETVSEIQYDANGRLRMVILESYGQHFDRSSEEWTPVIWTRHIERS